MNYIKNSSNEYIGAFLVKARPSYIKNKSNSNMLNGSWFIQSIGTKAEKLSIQLICTWTVLQEIFEYADTGETIEISFIDFVKSGVIIESPTYEILVNNANPVYTVDFDLAVMSSV